jgi:hypothetical protein
MMTLADVFQLAAIILAAIGVIASMRSSSSSRETQVVMELFNRIQDEWVAYWREALETIEAMEPAQVMKLDDAELEDKVRRALNMLDWIGHLMRGGHLRQARTLNDAIGSTIIRTIDAAKPLLESDIKRHGKEHWAGLLYLEKQVRKN